MAENDGPGPSPGNDVPIPPIVAAFFVNFDNRKGYTLSWHRQIDGLQVEGVVEFKSLPSGLHNVEEDLVYFVYDEYAGISAFINRKDEESDRNARMLAVGVLVPLEQGRMGKSWRHAEGLKELARKQVANISDATALEAYWETYKLEEHDYSESLVDSPSENNIVTNDTGPNGYQKSRSMSTGSVFFSSDQTLAAHHPALSLLEFLQSFGPLIFPLYRAALLQKRILLVGEAPVEFACSLVYNLSILSSLPKALLNFIPIDRPSNLRLRPLFNVGVHDIPMLQKRKMSQHPAYSDDGWVACTTDDVLSTKPQIFDLLVFLPNADAKNTRQKIYPKIVESSPELARSFPKVGLRSTQRDAFRYRNLRASLREFPRSEADGDLAVESTDQGTPTSSAPSSVFPQRDIVEPASWSLVAYNSFVWWASAGDRRAGLTEAEDTDRELDSSLLADDGEQQRTKEVAMVAFFHNMTSLIFGTISDAVARVDGDNDRAETAPEDNDSIEGDREERLPTPNGMDGAAANEDENEQLLAGEDSLDDIEITHGDMQAMGLDVWSASDRKFVEDLIELWWGRQANVRGGTVECCGVRIL